MSELTINWWLSNFLEPFANPRKHLVNQNSPGFDLGQGWLSHHSESGSPCMPGQRWSESIVL